MDSITNILLNVYSRSMNGYDIYPDFDRIFFALSSTKPDDIHAIILGLDPYGNKSNGNIKDACGKCFLLSPDIEAKSYPKSAKIIYSSLVNDINFPEELLE